MPHGRVTPPQPFPWPYGYLHGKKNTLQVSLPSWYFCISAEVAYKNLFLKNLFAIFTGNHMFWSLLLIKKQAFRLATLLKSNISVFLRILRIFLNTYFEEHLQRLPVKSFFAIPAHFSDIDNSGFFKGKLVHFQENLFNNT